MRERKTAATVSARLSEADAELLGVCAFAEGLTRSELVRRLVIEYLNRTTKQRSNRAK
jgi:hypothetical protein